MVMHTWWLTQHHEWWILDLITASVYNPRVCPSCFLWETCHCPQLSLQGHTSPSHTDHERRLVSSVLPFPHWWILKQGTESLELPGHGKKNFLILKRKWSVTSCINRDRRECLAWISYANATQAKEHVPSGRSLSSNADLIQTYCLTGGSVKL